MRRCSSTESRLGCVAARSFVLLLAIGCAVGADDPDQVDLTELHAQHHRAVVEPSFMERASAAVEGLVQVAVATSRRIGQSLIRWYMHTPPSDRVTWGGMTASRVWVWASCSSVFFGSAGTKSFPLPSRPASSTGCMGAGSIVARPSIIVSATRARRHGWLLPRSAAGAGRPPISNGWSRWRTAWRASGSAATSEPCGASPCSRRSWVCSVPSLPWGAPGRRRDDRASRTQSDGIRTTNRRNPDRMGPAFGRRAHTAFRRADPGDAGSGRLRRSAHAHRKAGRIARPPGG